MEYPKRLDKIIIKNLVLNVTDICNLACKYCFTLPNPSEMELDTGIQAINWFVETNKEKSNESLESRPLLSISFFGGEPTLRWDEFIVPIVKYVKTYIEPKYKDSFSFRFSCTTNGQLLNEERISWFISQGGNFLLSIDGNRETQNCNRPRKDGKDSFDAIEKIIDILLKYQPDLTFRSTITPAMVHNLSKDYLFARKKGFRNWFAIPNMREEWTEDKIKILEKEMTIISGVLFRDICQNQQALSFNWFNRMIKDIMTSPSSKPHYVRCGLGTTSIGCATDGSLFACQENSTYHDESNLFFIGDIWSGINKERHLKLLEKFDGQHFMFCSKENCELCPLTKICQNWSCPSTNYALSGNVMDRPQMMCEWLRIIYYCASNMILNAAENESKDFIYWLTRNIEIKGGLL